MLVPVGELQKERVRALAAEAGLAQARKMCTATPAAKGGMMAKMGALLASWPISTAVFTTCVRRFTSLPPSPIQAAIEPCRPSAPGEPPRRRRSAAGRPRRMQSWRLTVETQRR